MSRRRLWAMLVTVLLLVAALLASAQETAVPVVALDSGASIPRLIKFAGTITDAQGVVGVTFALYKDQNGGAPLWLETQSVPVDAHGHYTVFLGANSRHGLPPELFAAAEARWLSIQPEGQKELARVLLVSVPYALKAGDAETLGGYPLSAFVLTSPTNKTAAGNYINPAPIVNGANNNGTLGHLPKFVNNTDLGDSVLTEISGNVGIGTENPQRPLHIRGSRPVIRLEDTNYTSSFWELQQSAFNSGYFGFVRYENGAAVEGKSMVIANDGSVGFGTGTPQRPLHIKGPNPSLRLEDTNFPNSYWEMQQSAFHPDFFGFLRYENNEAVPNKSLVISNTGLVGLGTVNPTEKLTVAGNVKLVGEGSAIIFADGTSLSTRPVSIGSLAAGDASITVSGSSSDPTVAVADGGISAAKLANNAVQTAHVTDLNITSAKLADNAVTSAKIADGAVTDAKIGAGTISPSKITGTAATLGSNTFNGDQTVTGTMTATALAGNGALVTNVHAATADSATVADTATSATHATTADNATTASSATNADHAFAADNATNATHATAADSALLATDAAHAVAADAATNADHAITADTATDAAKLAGVDSTTFARKDQANTFSDVQTMAGAVLPAKGTADVDTTVQPSNTLVFNNSVYDGRAAANNQFALQASADVAMARKLGAKGSFPDKSFAPVSKLEFLFGMAGVLNPTGLWIDQNGLIHFADGQAFTGDGSGLTNVAADNLGGHDISEFALQAQANSFTGNQSITGSVTATGNVTAAGTISAAAITAGTINATTITGDGSGITSVGAANFALSAANAHSSDTLNGIAPSQFARIDSANTLSGDQRVDGNLYVRYFGANRFGVSTSGDITMYAKGTANGTTEYSSSALTLAASIWKGSTTAQDFQLFAEPDGDGSSHLRFGFNSTPNGLWINPDGTIHFAASQSFPAPDSSTLGGIAAANYARLDQDNSFSGNQSVANNLTVGNTVSAFVLAAPTVNATNVHATALSGDGAEVMNVNAKRLAGLAASQFARQDQPNTFVGPQSVNGDVAATGTIAATNLVGNGSLVTNVDAAKLNGVDASVFVRNDQLNAFSAPQSFAGATLTATGTADAGNTLFPSNPLVLDNSVFDGSVAQNNAFVLQATADGAGTPSPVGKLELLYGISGVTNPTGFWINQDGTVHFAASQVFTGDGSGLTNVSVATAENANRLGGVPAKFYAATNQQNEFDGDQAIMGNLLVSNNVNAQVVAATLGFQGDGSQITNVHATMADTATNANDAVHATLADTATNANDAVHATVADTATSANFATTAGSANIATSAGIATDAASLGSVPATSYARLDAINNFADDNQFEGNVGVLGNFTIGGDAAFGGNLSVNAALTVGTDAIPAAGSVVIADGSGTGPFTADQPNQFAVRAFGGVKFVTGIDTGDGLPGVKLNPGDGSWQTLSDRNMKTNFAAVDSKQVLQRVLAMPIATWNYKAQDAKVKHMGPMAQDFFAAFKLGTDEKHISTVDADGVALAAIQGLYQTMQDENTSLKQQLEQKSKELDDLKARVEALEKIVLKK